MSEQHYPDDTVHEAGTITKAKNGANGSGKRPRNDPLPGLNVRELVEERNWSALAGLGLITLGALYVVADVLNLNFVLWAWMLMGAGGWLMVDAWQKYQSAGKEWVGSTRNRLLFGGLIALVGLFGTLRIDWWALLLMGAGGWLAWDTWKQVQAAGRTWTRRQRNRMLVAGVVGLIGFLALFPSWSTWPLLLIIIGAVMLYRHGRG